MRQASLAFGRCGHDRSTHPLVESLENRCLMSVTIDERAGLAFTATLGSFASTSPASDYTATIKWGDGSTSSAKLVSLSSTSVAAKSIAIVGSHTYAKAGDDTITVDVFGKGANDPFLTITDKAVVAPAVSSGGVTLDERANLAFTAIVGSFVAVVPATGLTATISWGDGSSSKGTLIPGKVTGLDTITDSAQGKHEYSTAGTYDITVVVTKPGAATVPSIVATIDSQAIVSPAVGTGGITITEAAGKKFTADVGSFSTTTPAGDLTADINWGDGSTSVGTILPGKSTGIATLVFEVEGTHTYAAKGNYDITITVVKAFGGVTPISVVLDTIDSEAIVIGPTAAT